MTAELDRKLVPVSAIVVAALPAVAEAGEMEVKVGTGLTGAVMLKVIPLEVPPPGAGFTTVMVSDPVEIKLLALITAVSEVELMYVRASSEPFHITSEAAMKLDPVRVTVVSLLPAGAEVGLTEVRAGAGLLGGGVTVLLLPELQPTRAREKAIRSNEEIGLKIRADMVSMV